MRRRREEVKEEEEEGGGGGEVKEEEVHARKESKLGKFLEFYFLFGVQG